DVICGHLDPDLAVIADDLLEPDELLHADETSDADFEERAALADAEDPEYALDGEFDDHFQGDGAPANGTIVGHEGGLEVASVDDAARSYDDALTYADDAAADL